MEILFTTNEQTWLETRKGKFTASEIHKLMGGSRSGGLLSQTAETYVYEKCAELLTGEIKNTYAPALDWGKEYKDGTIIKKGGAIIKLKTMGHLYDLLIN